MYKNYHKGCKNFYNVSPENQKSFLLEYKIYQTKIIETSDVFGMLETLIKTHIGIVNEA